MFAFFLDFNDEANEEEILETCENCDLTEPKTSILIHIGNTKACKAHYGPRFKAMQALNEREQKQRSVLEETTGNKSNKDRSRMSGQHSDLESTCDFCNKSVLEKNLLRHIGKNSACKTFYGSRFKEMKKEQERVRKAKNRQKISQKDQKKALKKQREKYAKDLELQKKKQQWHKIWKDRQEKEKQEQVSKRFEESTVIENSEESNEGTEENILLRSTENLKKVFEEAIVFCQFCKKQCEPNTILKHIGNVKNCKSFYGEQFEVFKKEQKRLALKSYQLAKERENYASKPELREKKKNASKKSYLDLKEKKKVQKKEEHQKFLLESGKEKLSYDENKCRDINHKARKRLSWLNSTFNHFFETFPQINEQPKNKLLSLENNIQKLHQKIENDIDELKQKVNDKMAEWQKQGCTYKQEGLFENAFKKNLARPMSGYVMYSDEWVQKDWEKLERNIGQELNAILEKIEGPYRNADWFYILEKIHEAYQEKFPGRLLVFHYPRIKIETWNTGYDKPYYPSKTCIVCGLKPNCIEKTKKQKD